MSLPILGDFFGIIDQGFTRTNGIEQGESMGFVGAHTFSFWAIFARYWIEAILRILSLPQMDKPSDSLPLLRTRKEKIGIRPD